jgi:signal transduction histidine kinase
MKRASLGLDRKRLRRVLSLFFLALAAPAAVLVYQAYAQLKWESFHQHRQLAEELAGRVDARLERLIQAEEERSFADYAFLVVAGDPAANFVQRSPLSDYPPKSALSGLLGYFQVDARGFFSTPLLPPRAEDAPVYGISGPERESRLDLQNRVLDILSRNRLVRSRIDEAQRESSGYKQDRRDKDEEKRESSDEREQAQAASKPEAAGASAPVESQAAFDKLSDRMATLDFKKKAESLGAVENREADKAKAAPSEPLPAPPAAQAYAGKGARLEKRAMRKELEALPEQNAAPARQMGRELSNEKPRVATFESEIDPLEFSRLDSGHFVLFRKVWRDGQRYIQGMILETGPFLDGAIETEFRRATLARMSHLQVAYQGQPLRVFQGAVERGYAADAAGDLQGELLYRARLSAPLDSLEVVFAIDRLPPGPGGAVLVWLSGILAFVLCGGFYSMYRLGARQIDLARQQQDFISAVSHELKTPLTSIRMYGEMLREGWANEEKKATYYDFICSESERLSRLIANVLQLARITRNGLDLDLKPIGVSELLDQVRSKISSLAERAGFALEWPLDEETARASVKLDADGFAQIVINLVDNAIKFSAQAPRKQIDIGCRQLRDGDLAFYARDYGPGIPKDRMKKIFELFYRLENELTRETVGTGIGLALVRQLALAMNARIEVVNREPGAEFRAIFRGERD